MNAVSVRSATLMDSAEMVFLLDQLDYPGAAAAVGRRLAALLARNDYNVMVAEAENTNGLIGLICCCWGLSIEHDGRWGQITALVVAEPVRGRGVGSLLVAHAQAWLQAHHVDKIIVCSSLRRTNAHHFYENQGFRKSGFRFERRVD